MTHTPGPWRIGKNYGAVVADHPVPGMGGSDAVEHYGGHLVAESIAPNNRALIAAAPDLLDVAEELLGVRLMAFDDAAELFHRETGMMAPGKDVAARSHEATTAEERRARWDVWCETRRQALNAKLALAIARAKG